MSGSWITPKRRYALIQRDDCTCQYCQSPVIARANTIDGYAPNQIATLDHIIARNNGGDNSNENLITVCMSCNSSKKDIPLELFVRDQDRVYTILAQALKPCTVQFRKRVN